MIFNKSDYNPLPEIRKILAKTPDKMYTMGDFDLIRKELYQGGVVPEDEEEFNTVIKSLLEMEIE